MSVKIGINGFGRIGRLMFRQAIQDNTGKFKIMAINDSKDIKYLMYLLKYDSVHGKLESPKKGSDHIGNMSWYTEPLLKLLEKSFLTQYLSNRNL